MLCGEPPWHCDEQLTQHTALLRQTCSLPRFLTIPKVIMAQFIGYGMSTSNAPPAAPALGPTSEALAYIPAFETVRRRCACSRCSGGLQRVRVSRPRHT